MLNAILSYLGSRHMQRSMFGARRGHHVTAPRAGLGLGGVLLPAAAYLAWQNRDKIRAMYDQYVRHQTTGAPMPSSPNPPRF